MRNPATRAQQLKAQITAQQLKLSDIQRALTDCMLDLSSQSNEAALLAEFESLTEQESKLTMRLEGLRRLLAVASGMDSADARASAVHGAKSDGQKAKMTTQERLKLIAEIQGTIDRFSAQMAAYDALNAQCVEDVRATVRPIMDERQFAIDGYWQFASVRIPLFDDIASTIRDHLRDVPSMELAERNVDRLADRIDRQLRIAEQSLQKAAA